MKSLFINDTVEVIVNNSTNEVFIRALKTKDEHGMRASLRIGVDDEGFSLTNEFCEYVPKSFNGLPGFHIRSVLL